MRSDVALREAWERSHPFPIGSPFWIDETLRASVERSDTLRQASRYFPADLTSKIFGGQEEIGRLWSSYRDHGYGYLFYALAWVLRPKRCVEIGVFHGFGLLTVDAALRDNDFGTVIGFDLFESYAYSHGHHAEVQDSIAALGLGRWAMAVQAEAESISQRFDEVDYLHVDISNDGQIFGWMFDEWAPKVAQIMIFEGGAAERDRVPWMIDYNRVPIGEALDERRRRQTDWQIVVPRPCPSVTLAIRFNQ